jgi:hypothetical protein
VFAAVSRDATSSSADGELPLPQGIIGIVRNANALRHERPSEVNTLLASGNEMTVGSRGKSFETDGSRACGSCST